MEVSEKLTHNGGMKYAQQVYSLLHETLDYIVYINEVSKGGGDLDERMEEIHTASIQLEEIFVFLKRLLENRKP